MIYVYLLIRNHNIMNGKTLHWFIPMLLMFASGFTLNHLQAQTVRLSGSVIDSLTSEPLIGAHVVLRNRTDSLSTVTEADGSFVLQVKPGFYRIAVSYLGYGVLRQPVRVQETMTLPALKMQQEAEMLDQIEVTDRAVRATQKGDTTAFRANAYKTNSDASTEELVRKMPGITVQNGEVQAQGEKVQKVLVDGREFFGNDANAALRNLPAEVVDQIQVFDDKTEQAKFSGVDDGETIKTINIVTRSDKRNGQFGRLYAGYGDQEKYQAGGQVNFFNKNRRVSILGMSNNINIQNFSSEDIIGFTGSSGGRGRGRDGDSFIVGQQNGITTTHALGLNYSDKWGEKIEVTASYFVNSNDNLALQSQQRDYASIGETNQIYDENSRQDRLGTNHRFNMRMEYKINDKTSILWRPRLSYQTQNETEASQGFNSTALAINNSTDLLNTNINHGLNLDNSILLRRRLEKPGRTFSVELKNNYNNRNGDETRYALNNFYSPQEYADTLDQVTDLYIHGWEVGTEVDYTEPLGKKGSLQVEYEYSYNWDDADQRTFDVLNDQGQLSSPIASLSSTLTNNISSHEIGLRYRLRGEKTNLTLGNSLQTIQMDADQVYPEPFAFKKNFVNWLPNVFLRIQQTKQNYFFMGYRTFVRTPTANQLQEVVDNSNPLLVSIGNSALNPYYSHRIFLRYSNTQVEKSTVFYALLNANFSKNYIARSTQFITQDTIVGGQYALSPGTQLSQSVNLNGYMNLNGFVTYGLPVDFLKSNLNFNVGGDYLRQPGLINGIKNYSNTYSSKIGLVLASNISEKIDFTLASTSSLNWVRNTSQISLDNRYLNQINQAGMVWTFLPGWVFRQDVTNQLYRGLGGEFDINFWLWNMSLGKKFLKNNRGELKLSVFDLLGQNNSISRTITETYIQDLQTNVLQRYFLLSFVYTLRSFGTPPAEPERRDWRH